LNGGKMKPEDRHQFEITTLLWFETRLDRVTGFFLIRCLPNRRNKC